MIKSDKGGTFFCKKTDLHRALFDTCWNAQIKLAALTCVICYVRRGAENVWVLRKYHVQLLFVVP